MKDITFAGYSSEASGAGKYPGIALEGKGSHSLLVLAECENDPKGDRPTADKVTKILVENYLRRPSIKTEGLQQLVAFANDGVLTVQSPQARVACSLAAIFIQKDAFRIVACGNARVYHFVNKQLVSVFPDRPSPRLGEDMRVTPQLSDIQSFSKGENAFLICTAPFASAVSIDQMEEALTVAGAGDSNRWLGALEEIYEDAGPADGLCTAAAMILPEKKKRLGGRKLIILIAVLLVIAAGVFFGMGAMRRQQPGGLNQKQTPVSEQIRRRDGFHLLNSFFRAQFAAQKDAKRPSRQNIEQRGFRQSHRPVQGKRKDAQERNPGHRQTAIQPHGSFPA